MPSKKFTVKELDAQRRSATRVYTHVVAGWMRLSETQLAERSAYQGSITRHRVREALEIEAAGLGGIARPEYPSWKVSEQDLLGAMDTLAEHGRDLVVAYKRAESAERARLEEHNRAARVHVLQWSQSEANARKALGTFSGRGYIELRVMPTDQHAEQLRLQAQVPYACTMAAFNAACVRQLEEGTK